MWVFFYFVFDFAILSCLCHAALWSLARKSLAYRLSCIVMFSCVFVTFPYGILCQVWYLIYPFLIFATFPTSISKIIV